MPSSASSRRWTWCAGSDRPRGGRPAARRGVVVAWLVTGMVGALAGGLAVAAPALQLQCPPSALPQQPFDCQVRMNLPAGAEGTVSVTLPPRLMRVAEPPGWAFDVAARRWSVPASGAGAATATLTLIADANARGGTHAVVVQQAVDGQPVADATAEVAVGGVDTIDLGVATLPLPPWVFSAAWLLAMAALVGAARQRDLGRSATAPRAWPWALGVAVAATAALPTVTAFVDQVRARTVFERAACEVLDHAVSPSPGQPEDGWPMAALRIRADGGTWVGTGFEPRSAIFRASAADDHLRFPRGSRPACWVDPARPGRVILRQAPLAALAVAPALLAALGVLGVGLRRVW